MRSNSEEASYNDISNSLSQTAKKKIFNKSTQSPRSRCNSRARDVPSASYNSAGEFNKSLVASGAIKKAPKNTDTCNKCSNVENHFYNMHTADNLKCDYRNYNLMYSNVETINTQEECSRIYENLQKQNR